MATDDTGIYLIAMNLKKAIYPLAEAAELLRCDADDLLRQGAEGTLSLYVRTPDGVDLYNVGYSDLHAKIPPSELDDRPQPVRASNIDFLKLPPTDCQQLLNAGMSMSSTFKEGGKLATDGNLRCAKAPCPPHYKGMLSAYSGLDPVIRYFATYRPGIKSNDWATIARPKAIEVTPEDLLLTRMEILELKNRQASVPREVLGQVLLDVQPHTSPMLQQLHDLHSLIWGRAHLPDFKPPSKEVIIARLLHEYGFSGNLAKCGAEILHETSLETDARSGQPRLLASRMNALIECSDKHWSTSRDPKLDRSNEGIADWLATKCGLPKHLGKAAATLIRPSNAHIGRPSNKM